MNQHQSTISLQLRAVRTFLRYVPTTFVHIFRYIMLMINEITDYNLSRTPDIILSERGPIHSNTIRYFWLLTDIYFFHFGYNFINFLQFDIFFFLINLVLCFMIKMQTSDNENVLFFCDKKLQIILSVFARDFTKKIEKKNNKMQ